jgi:hypothetical protein
MLWPGSLDQNLPHDKKYCVQNKSLDRYYPIEHLRFELAILPNSSETFFFKRDSIANTKLADTSGSSFIWTKCYNSLRAHAAESGSTWKLMEIAIKFRRLENLFSSITRVVTFFSFGAFQWENSYLRSVHVLLYKFSFAYMYDLRINMNTIWMKLVFLLYFNFI